MMSEPRVAIQKKVLRKLKKGGVSVDIGHEIAEQGKSVDTAVFLMIR